MAQAFIDRETNQPGMKKVKEEIARNQELSQGELMRKLLNVESELKQNQSVAFPDFSLLDK